MQFLTKLDNKILNSSSGIFSEQKYRIGIDDCILFLKDINDNKDSYKSIFDNKLLKGLKNLHEKYNAKFHLNLFYQTDSLLDFKNDIKHFDLSMMTSKFKEEFIKNSHWLTMSFHAKQNMPAFPYSDKKSEKCLLHDLKQVNKEIKRFAGKETLSSETTIHYGAISEKGIKKCKRCGYSIFSGFFKCENGNKEVSYYLNDDAIKYLEDNDFYFDKKNRVLFSKVDMIVNFYSNKEDAMKVIDKVIKEHKKHYFIDLLLHEQYFYEGFSCYIPDFINIIEAVVNLLTINKFACVLLDKELIKGK